MTSLNFCKETLPRWTLSHRLTRRQN